MYHVNLLANLLERRSAFKSVAVSNRTVILELEILFYFIQNFGISIINAIQKIANLNFYQDSTTTTTNHLNILTESNAVEFLCRLNEQNCLQKLNQSFANIPANYFLDPNSNNNPYIFTFIHLFKLFFSF